MNSAKRIVFNIQKCCVNDGPGIRTTVFLKGCMLNCLWCHNPESKLMKPQLMLHQNKCIGCLECQKICPRGLHTVGEDGKHLIDRESCIACGKCERLCPNGAIILVNNVPVIDYSKCTNCGACAEGCPRKCIKLVGEQQA